MKLVQRRCWMRRCWPWAATCLWVGLAMALTCGCSLPAVPVVAGAGQPAAPRLDAAHVIPDEATWQRLAARPEASAIARTEVVKFLVDVESGHRLWFTDTERFPFHYNFAFARLRIDGSPIGDHALFNQFEYSHPDRRFEMGSVVHYLDSDLWTMELVGGDNLSGARILRLFEQVRTALWIGDQLRFHPLSDLHEQSIADVRDRLPIASSDEVFGGIRYQPLTTGTTFGYLRLVRGAMDLTAVRADQILVLEELPAEIPVSAGVVSEQLQAPLGHIAILCATRGTPNMALREAITRPEFRELDGRLVALTVGPQDFSLREATMAEAEKHWAARRPRRPQVPRLSLEESGLSAVADLRLRDARFAGAKAAQLGEVSRLRGIRTPGGFVVPVFHYVQHLARSHAADDLAARLADESFIRDIGVRARWLEQVRTSIEQTEVDATLVQEVHARMQQLAPESRWILRSSTNAEDLAGFTGAGLYRSVRLDAGASAAELARAMREVWASVWLQGAFEERSWYRVDHRAVAMAILVQPFVDGAFANGVAITANPFAEMRPGFFINAQALGGSVTGAEGNEIPEQLLVYTFMDALETEVIARSSRTDGEALLRDQEIEALARVLRRLHAHFLPKWPGRANAVDVEFLLAGDSREVVILQARPYTVTYTPGRRFDPSGDPGGGGGFSPFLRR